ncbi:hypothetical protein CCACVL1_01238, partial [Corchorus capsularis]
IAAKKHKPERQYGLRPRLRNSKYPDLL